jgi:cellobiose-specific phosphotransferase system component IIC
MIKKFDTNFGSVSTGSTGSAGASGSSSKGGNGLITALVIGAGVYLGYKFIVKPMLDKKKAEESNDNIE